MLRVSMAKKKKTARQPSRPAESRGTEAATVFWMLTMMATLGAELASLVAWLLIAFSADRENIPMAFLVLPGLLLWIAVITGLICVAMAPVVNRLRQTAPPRGVTVIAVAVGISPILVLAAFQIMAAL